VNQWWICDAGRYSYQAINENRKDSASLKGAPALFEAALEAFAAGLKAAGPDKTAFLLSPQMTNEELSAWKSLAEQMGVKQVEVGDEIKRMGKEDKFLIKADKNPNSRGAADMGLGPRSGVLGAKEVISQAASGEFKALVVVDHEIQGLKAEFIGGLYSHKTATDAACHVSLPRASWAEQEGSFTNVQGKKQALKKALEPLGDARNGAELAQLIAQKLGLNAKVPA
jgi:NADH-quinone oxidoreductase subunit G